MKKINNYIICQNNFDTMQMCYSYYDVICVENVVLLIWNYIYRKKNKYKE